MYHYRIVGHCCGQETERAECTSSERHTASSFFTRYGTRIVSFICSVCNERCEHVDFTRMQDDAVNEREAGHTESFNYRYFIAYPRAGSIVYDEVDNISHDALNSLSPRSVSAEREINYGRLISYVDLSEPDGSPSVGTTYRTSSPSAVSPMTWRDNPEIEQYFRDKFAKEEEELREKEWIPKVGDRVKIINCNQQPIEYLNKETRIFSNYCDCFNCFILEINTKWLWGKDDLLPLDFKTQPEEPKIRRKIKIRDEKNNKK